MRRKIEKHLYCTSRSLGKKKNPQHWEKKINEKKEVSTASASQTPEDGRNTNSHGMLAKLFAQVLATWVIFNVDFVQPLAT
jgi:hypothetical protein